MLRFANGIVQSTPELFGRNVWNTAWSLPGVLG